MREKNSGKARLCHHAADVEMADHESAGKTRRFVVGSRPLTLSSSATRAKLSGIANCE
jgi:hypothetical protein